MSRLQYRRITRSSGRRAETTRYRNPRQSALLGLFSTFLAAACTGTQGDAAEQSVSAISLDIRPGIEVLLDDSLHLVQGLRIGLVTNHTGIDRAGRTNIDLLAEHEEIDLVALYSPEHGIRGKERAGAAIESGFDEQTGLPVHSLYGETRKPTTAMLEGVDVLLFDMQDIGARYYTYVSTMALAMTAAGEHGIPFVVLDRPNPIRGDVVQGTVLDPEYSTFVGMYPVPMRHGMTPGELARMYVGAFGIQADLMVVPVDGWTRDVIFDDTGLPWVPPSPNIPTVASALAYPGTCLFEGTPLSVGRGTDRAFQWIGAPWLDGNALAAALNLYEIEGVHFEGVRFTPTNAGDGKFEGKEVGGVMLVPESTDYDASAAAVAMLVETYRVSGDRWSWFVAHFDRLAGTDALRLGIESGAGFETLTAGWAPDLASFERLRAPYLIYE
ncbi:MAG: DUF1343 domain-containing protein [Longimicrobiales bacterium]|nr:DUF1343 domain-containing protein [Longimicrobiales bacterium]